VKLPGVHRHSAVLAQGGVARWEAKLGTHRSDCRI
jgi:hypothetical protein